MTFTLTILHTSDSTANAYDVVVTDTLPVGLDLYCNSLECTSGAQDPDVGCVYDVGTRTIRAEWSVFALNGGSGQIRFRVVGNTLIPANGNVTNIANVEWTSMPGDQPYPLVSVPANQFATERYYDPTDLINLYGDSDSSHSPLGGGGLIIPEVGFAPDRVTELAPSTYMAFNPTGLALDIPC